MKHAFLILFMAAIAAVASAQTSPNPPAASPSTAKSSSPAPATPAGTPTSTAKPAAAPAAPTAASAKPVTAAPSALTPWIKLPVGVPKVAHGPVKIPFALRYEDIKVGTGPVGESGKLWHIKYTGWRAADGVKFDSWDEHGKPVMGPDGKPELGPDGKPKLGDADPIAIPQGTGRVIPGFDYGLEGMRVGGKRRIFIPWEMAYGTRAIPDRPDHPGIPAKSDLIFDMELVDVTDMPAPPQRPTMPIQRPGVPPRPGSQPNAAPAAPQTPPASAPAQPSTPPQSGAPGQPSPPAQPSAPAPPSTSAPATPPAQPVAPAPPSTPGPATPPAQPQPR